MSKYIDCENCYHGKVCAERHIYHDMIVSCPHHIPTADVKEVKHGYNKSSMNPVDEFICSECGAMFADVSLVKEDEENGDINYYEFEFKYCPNCGAKMSEFPTGSKRSD